MTLRRGFKSEANATALEVRAELGLGDHDRLDPWQLADHLGVPVSALSGYTADAPFATEHFIRVDTRAFSAMTVFDGPHRREIVHNDAHPPGRQASNVTHELSHALLLHDPTPALDDKGCRSWNQQIEEEAEWLGGALLLTEEAALRIARREIPVATAARDFGISVEMVNWRLNMTGARKRTQRSSR